ncbi:MAG: hypothetical protein GY946_04915 [bacterium]|nr:hypothetical protein [bacterium]
MPDLLKLTKDDVATLTPQEIAEATGLKKEGGGFLYHQRSHVGKALRAAVQVQSGTAPAGAPPAVSTSAASSEGGAPAPSAEQDNLQDELRRFVWDVAVAYAARGGAENVKKVYNASKRGWAVYRALANAASTQLDDEGLLPAFPRLGIDPDEGRPLKVAPKVKPSVPRGTSMTPNVKITPKEPGPGDYLDTMRANELAKKKAAKMTVTVG